MNNIKKGSLVRVSDGTECIVRSNPVNGKVKITALDAWNSYKRFPDSDAIRREMEAFTDWYSIEDLQMENKKSVKTINEAQLRKIIAESIKKVLVREAKERSMDIAARNAAFADIRKDYENSFPKIEPYTFSGDLSALDPQEKAAFLQCKERILKTAKRKGIELPEEEVNRRAAINANLSDYRRHQREKMDAYQDRQDNRPDLELLKKYDNNLSY